MAQYKGAAKEASRAMNLMKKRQKEQEELEMKKKKIEDELKLGEIRNKFAVHYDAVESQLKSSTVGLVTLDEMRAKQEDVMKQRDREVVIDKKLQNTTALKDEKKKKKENKRSLLSFDVTEEDEIPESNELKKFKMQKCPDVDTSYLPDRERDQKEAILREQLRQEWVEKQEKIKNEDIEITYSYWDGSGHRRQVKMKKGSSIQQFLQKCLEQLRREFNELKTASVDRLMYIKEDLIIAHHYTFYDFIVTKARGKSGPLFNFDVHDDVRMVSDATIEKDESHAGKVCLRSWYEKNKHIFPASRWEPYDPEKKWDKYTISDSLAVI